MQIKKKKSAIRKIQESWEVLDLNGTLQLLFQTDGDLLVERTHAIKKTAEALLHANKTVRL
jgi:hypothetical protein